MTWVMHIANSFISRVNIRGVVRNLSRGEELTFFLSPGGLKTPEIHKISLVQRRWGVVAPITPPDYASGKYVKDCTDVFYA